MRTTKYFEIHEARAHNLYYIISMITARCAGAYKDPDTNEDWTGYENIDVSIVRTRDVNNLDAATQVSDLMWEFTVEELAAEYSSSDCMPEIFDMGHEVAKLPIGRVRSSYFVKVELY